MATNVYRKSSGSVTLKESRGERKLDEIAVGDDMTIGAMKDEIVKKLASGRPTGERSMAKTSWSEGGVQIIHGEVLADRDPKSKSKGEQLLAKKSRSGQAKIRKEEEGSETKSVTENEENSRTLKRKRGADGEMVLAYLSSQEKSSARLRPRQAPTFRMVDLGENDDNRIVDKRIKVYWPESRKWFTGHIKAFDDKKGLHSILYDDGDKEELDLRKERFELEILPTEGFNLKADTISKKKGRGLDGNEVSPLMLPEMAFKVGDVNEELKSPELNAEAKEVMMTPESKKKAEAKKMGRSGSLKLQRKSNKVKGGLAAEMEKMDAGMDVDVKRDGLKKTKLHADANVQKTMEVDHPSDNDKIEALEQVGEKKSEGLYEGQATALNIASEKSKVSLEGSNLNGDMEDKENQAEKDNITASEDAVISSILSFRSSKHNMENLPPNMKVSIHTDKIEDVSEEISAHGTPDVDTVKTYNESKSIPEATGEAACEISVDLRQPQMESALVLTESTCTSPSKLHLPKNPEEGNPDALQENLKVKKCQPEEESKKEMESASQKTVEGGKTQSN